MYKKIGMLLFILFITPAYALQIKKAVNNETITAKISAIDVTRIFVEGDRIKSVKGVQGAYTRDSDDEKGEIYIQPTAEYQNQSFTMLVETEQGQHFTLVLTPEKLPSQTIMLVSPVVRRVQAEKFEASSPYEQTLVHMIKSMKTNLLPDGYVYKQVDKRKKTQIAGLEVRLRCIYEGYHFVGEVYELTNKNNYVLKVDERDFYKPGIRAISIILREIPAGATVQLYRVAQNA